MIFLAQLHFQHPDPDSEYFVYASTFFLLPGSGKNTESGSVKNESGSETLPYNYQWIGTQLSLKIEFNLSESGKKFRIRLDPDP